MIGTRFGRMMILLMIEVLVGLGEDGQIDLMPEEPSSLFIYPACTPSLVIGLKAECRGTPPSDSAAQHRAMPSES